MSGFAAGAPKVDARPQPLSLAQMIESALDRDEAQCAFRFGGLSRSAADVRSAAQDLAADLERRGLIPGEPVVIAIDHSFDLVTALCGVVLAGGAAVPLDTGAVSARQDAIMADIAPRLVLRQVNGGGVRIDVAPLVAAPPADPDLAFVVYTSGSSGGPKGVEITHQAYAARLDAITAAIVPQEDAVDLVWTPASFIGLLDEVFFPVLSGITAVIGTPSIRTDPHSFAALVEAERITAFRATPSLLDMLLRSADSDRLQSLRVIYCSGETLGAATVALAHDRLNADLIGFYGATEAPGVAFHAYGRSDAAMATTICSPQVFADIDIVGPDSCPVADGATGEIWIGGGTIARGYWRRPELTARHFVTLGGERWYRTGDRGRWVGDGRFEVSGRADLTETGINGVRVNLLEIRGALLALEGIQDAWVSAVDPQADGRTVLVADCVMEDGFGFDQRAIKASLQAELPGASIPRFLFCRDRFPLTLNGKIDAQRLAADARLSLRRSPPNDGGRPRDDDVFLPVILDVAADMLEAEPLSGSDNFFAAGGNSLLAVNFALTLTERLGVAVMTTLVFNTDDFDGMARTLAVGRGIEEASLITLRGGAGPPLITINATGNYRALTRHIGGDHPIHNANIFGLTNLVIERLDELDLTDLAGLLAQQILDAYPHGPWNLMAFCQDGALAIEVARRLDGHETGRSGLLLLDTFFADHRASPLMLLRRTADLGPLHHLRRLLARIERRSLPERFEEMSPTRRIALMAKSRNDERLYRHYTKLFSTYEPSGHAGPAVLFVSRDWRHVKLKGARQATSDEIDVMQLTALHNTLFEPGALPALADAVERGLATLATTEERQ